MAAPPHGLSAIRAAYGEIKIMRDPRGGWRIYEPASWESRNCVALPLPTLRRTLYVHRLIAGPLLEALERAQRATPDYAIKTIGCFCPRPKRTVSQPSAVIGWDSGLSIHSVAGAVDVNALSNPMRRPLQTDMPPAFIDAWRAVGWTWGGDFPTPDPMHFQWASGY